MIMLTFEKILWSGSVLFVSIELPPWSDVFPWSDVSSSSLNVIWTKWFKYPSSDKKSYHDLLYRILLLSSSKNFLLHAAAANTISKVSLVLIYRRRCQNNIWDIYMLIFVQLPPFVPVETADDHNRWYMSYQPMKIWHVVTDRAFYTSFLMMIAIIMGSPDTTDAACCRVQRRLQSLELEGIRWNNLQSMLWRRIVMILYLKHYAAVEEERRVDADDPSPSWIEEFDSDDDDVKLLLIAMEP